MRTLTILALLSFAACNIELPDARNCDDRTAWYPDEDGDGVGEPTEVYIGCEAPEEGWVDNVDTGSYAGARRRGPEQGWRFAAPGASHK